MAWPLIAAALAAAGAGLSFWGQERANTANAKIAKEQMDFQEKMSGSSYQRATEDMRRAGLNPLLAYSQGGASSPGGASATMQNSANSALAAAQQIQSVQMTAKQMENVDANTRQIQSDTALKNLDWTMRNMERGDKSRMQDYFQFVDKDGKPVYGDAGQKTGAMPYAVWLARQQAEASLRMSNSASAANEATAALSREELPRYRREADMYRGPAGQFIPYLNSAGQAARSLRDFSQLIRR